ncbi:hypothetical protein V6N12_006267 [Hibiscus sabdariffa]|uniref:RNase H type-1 domain-containing protein n=1 Tax=Hibiscus sabdariffa TaxID=183260 RepID=A0ABR2EYB2_9ROSI
MLWTRRCRIVMEHGFFEPSDMFTLCSRLTMDFARCKDARLDDRADCPVRIGVANRVWIKPRWGWVKANADGNALVDDILELLSRDWEITVRKIPREMNKVKDALARSLCDGPMRVLLFVVPPIELGHLVLWINKVLMML